MNISERKNIVDSQFKTIFGTHPEIWSRAPGRVDLMGSHTDYNQGVVMTMTIDRDTWIVARPRNDGKVRIQSMNIEGEGNFELNNIKHGQRTPWSNYVRGMAMVMQNAGYTLKGFDGLVHSTVPFGSGLSSSAAFEMATGLTFSQLSDFKLAPLEMAKLGQRAENEFVGVNTGILDQYSSAMGRTGCAIHLDCRHLTSESAVINDNLQVIICDTRAKRNLTGTEYDDRRNQCEEGVRILQQHYPAISALRDVTVEHLENHKEELSSKVYARCRFIVDEHRRVRKLADALPTGDSIQLQRLFQESYRGARDLFEISVPAMEKMMSAMESAPGTVAARQAGAGFGGCMVALVDKGSTSKFAEHVQRVYQVTSGREPGILFVTASAGACPLVIKRHY